MGGAWEALIKSVKRALKVITRDRIFTEESLVTFLCEVESVINQRPLTSISDNLNDFEALTPYHLILGTSAPNPAPGQFVPEEINYRKKWRSVQAAADMFWQRWTREYLPTLIPRKKWRDHNRNFKPGDLVLVSSEHTHRSKWPLGRIIDVYPGKDNVVRIAKVRTPNNELIRSCAKLCLLEAAN